MNRLFTLLLLLITLPISAQVKLGIDVLREQNFAPIKGMRVGLVCHPASVDSRLISTIDVLRATDQCKLTAIFGPEHGVYGDVYAGAEVKDTIDPRTHIMAYSLYGKTKRPTTQMANQIDVMLFDLQDIGSRSYTFINTMKEVLRSCDERGIPLFILDRPNPLGGLRIEGPPTVEKGFESGISSLPVPYVHGMTMGELALFVKNLYCPKFQKLTIIKMQGWNREMTWQETGLKWLPTSPQIPTADAAFGYAATGFLGELGQLSNGCGYTLPFTAVGAPWVNGDQLYATLTGSKSATRPSSLGADPSIQWRVIRYKPFFATFKDEPCQGVQLFIDPHKTSNLVEINFRIMDALNAKALFAQAAQKDAQSLAANAKNKKVEKTHFTHSWDITCGSDRPRKWMIAGKPLQDLFDEWKVGCESFRESRKPYLLY